MSDPRKRLKEQIDSLKSIRSSMVPMTQEQQDRLKYLQKKMIHNHCVNPHCMGYVGEDSESTCLECGDKLYKFLGDNSEIESLL
jgi:hypothetical protein